MENKELQIIEQTNTLSLREVAEQVHLIQEVMRNIMKKDEHYGIIPGTTKPTLYKAGAEKINVTFRLAPTYKINRTDIDKNHREYEIVCTLTHIPTGQIFGEGVGMCSTMETKYRWRKGERLCPQCGQPAIIKGKMEYGGGWVCFTKKGGCNAKFADDDERITNQETGRVENPDVADQWNTVLKMAKKRALVDAVLTSTAASDIFTQDLEDFADLGVTNEKTDKDPPQPLKPVSSEPSASSDKQWGGTEYNFAQKVAQEPVGQEMASQQEVTEMLSLRLRVRNGLDKTPAWHKFVQDKIGYLPTKWGDVESKNVRYLIVQLKKMLTANSEAELKKDLDNDESNAQPPAITVGEVDVEKIPF